MADIEASHPKYIPGQIWSYKTRPGEAASRATILRVDRHPVSGQYIIHIGLEGLAVRSPTASDGFARNISHAPFAEVALSQSLVHLEGTGPIPDFQEGYRMWRTGFDQNKAGVWSVSIAEAISAMETVINQPQGEPS